MKKRPFSSENNGDRIYKRNRVRDETKTAGTIKDEQEESRANEAIRNTLIEASFSDSYIDDDDYSKLRLLLPGHSQESSPGSRSNCRQQIEEQNISELRSQVEPSESSSECNSTIDHLLSSVEKPQSRKQLLNEYIVQRIEGGSGKCGCSFGCANDNIAQSSATDLGSSNLLNNLDNFYEGIQFDSVLHDETLDDITTKANSAKSYENTHGNVFSESSLLLDSPTLNSNSVFIESPENLQPSATKQSTVVESSSTLLNDNNNNNKRINTEISPIELYFADSSDSEGCSDQFETSNALESLTESIFDRESPIADRKQARSRTYSLTSCQSRSKAGESLLSALDLEHRVSDWAQYQREHQKSLDCSLTNNSTVSLSWSQELPCNFVTSHQLQQKNNNYQRIALGPTREELEQSQSSLEDLYNFCNENERGLAQKCIVPLDSEDSCANLSAAQTGELDERSEVLSCLSAPKLQLNESELPLEGQQKTIATTVVDSMDHDNEISMKAAKDLAKMSIPSLSALQYLPSQMDAKNKIFGNQQQANAINKNKHQDTTTTSKTTQVDSELKIRVITESCEDIKHDESCLFDRLCLCNCMATRSQHQQQNALRESSSSSSFPSNDDKCSRRRSKRAKGSASPNKRREDRVKDDADGISEKRQSCDASLKAEESTDTVDAIIREQKYEQKQSPSFLNLLKSTLDSRDPRRSTKGELQLSSCDKSDDSYLPNARSSAGLYVSSSPSRGSPHLVGSTTGSLNGSPLEISSLALDANKDNNLNRTSRRLGRYSSCERPSLTTLSDGPTPSSLASQERSQSACSSTDCGHELELLASDEIAAGEHRKAKKRASTRNYRKYLSPSRLFAAVNKSDSEQQEVSLQQQQSFLTRSLNRLSYRRSSSKRKKSQVQSHESLESQSTCGLDSESSIPYSVGSSSHYKESSAPANSLESINLDETLYSSRLGNSRASTPNKSKILTAPEIVLHTVEHVHSAVKDNPMTRTGAYRYNSSESLGTGPIRCGSELNYDNDHHNDHERNYSRSSSPGGVQRRRAGGSRSPRLRESPVPFKSPATQSTKIEDGFRVCSIEHFEKHIGNIKDNQVEAQKKLFKAWINHFCPNLIQLDLVEELRDGIKLVGLLAYLTRDKRLLSRYEKLQLDKMSYINRLVITPSSRLKQLSNVSIAIDYLRKTVGMKLTNLNPMDVIDGKPNVILGLCWSIILHFQLDQNFLKYLESCEGTSEQTLSNWLCYNHARQKLNQWLVTAEEKLSQALGSVQLGTTHDQHMDRLQDLIDFFELEDMDVILAECDRVSQLGEFTKLDDRGSFCGSRLSLVSTSSRLSTLQTSKSAAHHRLLNEFELQCRLLASTLDSEQRASLLSGVKDLKSRLKHITGQRVPQVVNELRMNINQSKLIMEASEDDESEEELEQDSLPRDSIQLEQHLEDLEIECTQEDRLSCEEPAPDLEAEDTRTGKLIERKISRDAKSKQKNVRLTSKSSNKSKSSSPKPQKQKVDARMGFDKGSKDEEDQWSLIRWFLSKNKDQKQDVVKPDAQNNRSRRRKNNKSQLRPKPQSVGLTKVEAKDQDPNDLPLARLIWNKLKRAYKTSLSLNIILLICLAGICVVPLIHKDACCELTQGQVHLEDNLNIVRKPI